MDITPNEFKEKYLSGINQQHRKVYDPLPSNQLEEDVPESLDWRKRHVVSAVKDQGNCGSSWAFSAVGNIEGQYALLHDQILNFSVQQLVDCDKIDDGCNGGLMDDAFTYIKYSGGLMIDDDYQYSGKQRKCKFDPSNIYVKVKSYIDIDRNERKMTAALSQYGPLSVGIDAKQLQFYQSGIFDPLECTQNINHGVLIVGYGLTENNVQYWIVKNSWGDTWGESGYFRIVKGVAKCGIDQYVTTALIE